MNQETYEKVVNDMRLPSGELFGLPIIFDTNDPNIAVMTIEDRYKPDKVNECKQCYGQTTLEHPGVLMVATERGEYYVGGTLQGLNKPVREFECRTPAEVRETLPDEVDIVAF